MAREPGIRNQNSESEIPGFSTAQASSAQLLIPTMVHTKQTAKKLTGGTAPCVSLTNTSNTGNLTFAPCSNDSAISAPPATAHLPLPLMEPPRQPVPGGLRDPELMNLLPAHVSRRCFQIHVMGTLRIMMYAPSSSQFLYITHSFPGSFVICAWMVALYGDATFACTLSARNVL